MKPSFILQYVVLQTTHTSHSVQTPCMNVHSGNPKPDNVCNILYHEQEYLWSIGTTVAQTDLGPLSGSLPMPVISTAEQNPQPLNQNVTLTRMQS